MSFKIIIQIIFTLSSANVFVTQNPQPASNPRLKYEIIPKKYSKKINFQGIPVTIIMK